MCEEFDRSYWLGKLTRWSDPETFDNLVDDCSAALGPPGPMIRHGTDFWRDAWIASQFAKQSGAGRVRLLHPAPYPDFAVVLDGREFKFEATEALRENRRRGDEFREDLEKLERGENAVRHDPVEDWLTPDSAARLLRRCSESKARKSYASTCGLVIYLNESEYRTNEPNIRRTFLDATAAAGRAFQSVDVFWNSRFQRVWTAGGPLDQATWPT